MKIWMAVAFLAVVGGVHGVKTPVASRELDAVVTKAVETKVVTTIDSAQEVNFGPRVVQREDNDYDDEPQESEAPEPEEAVPDVQDEAQDDYSYYAEETGVPDAPTDETKGDDTKADETKADETKADDAKAADAEVAVRDFQMSCNSCVDAEPMVDLYDYSLDYEENLDTIFEKKELVGLWKSCTEAPGKLSTDNCYVDDKYSDRISFVFNLGFSNAYTLTPPVVTSTGGEIGSPLPRGPQRDPCFGIGADVIAHKIPLQLQVGPGRM